MASEEFKQLLEEQKKTNDLLTLANKDTFTLPHDGWQYYDSIASACTALNLNLDDQIMKFYPDYNPEEFEKRNGFAFGS